MSVDLPASIAAYFTADRTERAAVADCFTQTAIVKDEGKTHSGREAIRRWKTESASKYTYVSEPFAVARAGERTIVTSRVTGNFPGSPIDLRYAFTLDGDKIAALEITL
ncbi:polyketide cyclase [Asticcacaulis sp. AC466]|uniref:nuclear transport factor 2 family protein n=1 Tax=Asticcacaulis sp. AC466 TaxID=1282362 RepID=UPI0003C3F0D0|nr:nuclear transport factor 2 family protein [Asticcacaulis sp. AC466]ESQ82145.1 polyketide cyclase [Asticcacaulis sp. AC466]